jgi:hypothetical protein
MFIPPESICYYHNHLPDAHQTTDIDTHLRVTLFATPIFVGFGAQNAAKTGVYFDQTKRYIELSKNFCRAVMENDPKVYHHTAFIGLTEPCDWCVLEYAAPDKSCGYVGVFRLGTSGDTDEYILKLRGIDKSLSYSITLDNDNSAYVVSGKELTGEGLTIHLENAITSELVLYKAITN